MELFKPDDFKIFDIKGFSERMTAIRTRIRPMLTSIGEELAPLLSRAVDRTLYVHVAKHAQRTVNAPDDTWAAMGASPRGYKKDVHFKVAVSRHCVRFLFEAGPEYYAKPQWALAWHSDFKNVARGIQGKKHLAWFKNEHDEDPAMSLGDMAPAQLKKLADDLIRRKDGQFVLGCRIAAADFVKLTPKQVENLASKTFEPLAPLFHVYEARVLA